MHGICVFRPPRTSVDDLALEGNKMVANFLHGLTTLKRAGSSSVNLAASSGDEVDQAALQNNGRRSTANSINSKKLYNTCMKNLLFKSYLAQLKIVTDGDSLLSMVTTLDKPDSSQPSPQPPPKMKSECVIILIKVQVEEKPVDTRSVDQMLQSPYAVQGAHSRQQRRVTHNALVPTQEKYYPVSQVVQTQHQSFCPMHQAKHVCKQPDSSSPRGQRSFVVRTGSPNLVAVDPMNSMQHLRPHQPPPYELAMNLRRQHLAQQLSRKPVPPPRTVTSSIPQRDIEQRHNRQQRIVLNPTNTTHEQQRQFPFSCFLTLFSICRKMNFGRVRLTLFRIYVCLCVSVFCACSANDKLIPSLIIIFSFQSTS
ncbi:hypothetical protein Ciccas_004256 [Cichlidogyrus casuarinus]|uniref:Uncharacterized protein n=1 Tax=Cichlidogyrus casuarinus TaxID=1844966 RepID=A0ABD2QC09_9PLAT